MLIQLSRFYQTFVVVRRKSKISTKWQQDIPKKATRYSSLCMVCVCRYRNVCSYFAFTNETPTKFSIFSLYFDILPVISFFSIQFNDDIFFLYFCVVCANCSRAQGHFTKLPFYLSLWVALEIVLCSFVHWMCGMWMFIIIIMWIDVGWLTASSLPLSLSIFFSCHYDYFGCYIAIAC